MKNLNPSRKWRFAIGTTSRVPGSGGLHYFIADFDSDRFPLTDFMLTIQLSLASNIILQKTRHGWHVYTDYVVNFKQLVALLKWVQADPVWIKIGKERGYYFLADKSEIDFPYPVEHMVLHYGKEKAKNSKTLRSSIRAKSN